MVGDCLPSASRSNITLASLITPATEGQRIVAWACWRCTNQIAKDPRPSKIRIIPVIALPFAGAGGFVRLSHQAIRKNGKAKPPYAIEVVRGRAFVTATRILIAPGHP